MIEISEVINWLREDSVVSRRGPNSIVVLADFYDYDINTQIYQLPTDKETVIKHINENLIALVDPDAEDSSVTIVCQEGTKQWSRTMIVNQGKKQVIADVMKMLKKSWDDVWKVSGWQMGSEHWEISWERVNLV